MAFTTQRFLHNNLADATNITASSQGPGTIQQAKKTGTGTALLTPSGSYTGANNLLYTLQCDAAGSVDGAATFQWRTSATAAGSWEATGVSATSTSFSLSNGVLGQFTSGTLVLNDKFQFWAYAENGPGKMFSHDRDDFWRSAATATSINLVIAHGTPKQCTALVIGDHNITASGTVTLERNATDSWGAPSYSQALTITSPMVLYFDNTYAFSRIVVADATNPAGYISIGKLYLGTYTALTGNFDNIPWGSAKALNITRTRNRSQAGKQTGRVFSQGYSFTTEYFPIRGSGDLEIIQAMFEATFDADTGEDKAVWLHYWYDDNTTMYLVRCMSEQFAVQYPNYAHYQVALEWEQQRITRVI